MSRFDRAVGLVRSLAIYHAIPTRQRRLRRLYAQFAGPGDIAFDIGAHAGNRTRALAAIGCRVVAVEPQPDFARLLRALFARTARVEIVEAAIGASPGRATLAISDRHPTVTTLATAWREARAAETEFAGVRWNRQIEAEVITLDRLIARFGVPSFVKIDVEGGELGVLAGLTQPIPAISFEYLTSALDQFRAAVARLQTLAPYRFNWSPRETYRLASSSWLTEEELLAELSASHAGQHGDVYARLS
jgi:FkbM family methyltransferase